MEEVIADVKITRELELEEVEPKDVTESLSHEKIFMDEVLLADEKPPSVFLRWNLPLVKIL